MLLLAKVEVRLGFSSNIKSIVTGLVARPVLSGIVKVLHNCTVTEEKEMVDNNISLKTVACFNFLRDVITWGNRLYLAAGKEGMWLILNGTLR